MGIAWAGQDGPQLRRDAIRGGDSGGLHELKNRVAQSAHLYCVARLDIQAQKRFGVARSHVKPPRIRRYGKAVKLVEIVFGVLRSDGRDHCRLIVDASIDFTARCIPIERGHQACESYSGLRLPQGRNAMQSRQHARVSPPEIAKIEMAGMLAPEHRIGVRHGLFNK